MAHFSVPRCQALLEAYDDLLARDDRPHDLTRSVRYGLRFGPTALTS